MKCPNLFLALTVLFALVTTLSSTLTEDQTANSLDHDNDDEDDPSDSLNVLDHDNDDEDDPSDSLYILDHDSDDEDDPSNSLIESSVLGSDHEAYISLRGANRFLSQRKTRAKMTCKKYPRICRAKGSTGPDCCKKKCINLLADRQHCGRCGKKCKYNEICCKRKCVNPLKHNKHCGGCGNSCGKGSSCRFGICGYA